MEARAVSVCRLLLVFITGVTCVFACWCAFLERARPLVGPCGQGARRRRVRERGAGIARAPGIRPAGESAFFVAPLGRWGASGGQSLLLWVVVQGPVADHGEHGEHAAVGQGEYCLVVVFTLSALLVVVGLGRGVFESSEG